MNQPSNNHSQHLVHECSCGYKVAVSAKNTEDGDFEVTVLLGSRPAITLTSDEWIHFMRASEFLLDQTIEKAHEFALPDMPLFDAFIYLNERGL